MQDKYKLCKRAGLAIIKQHGFYSPDTPFESIEAADVEKMLEGAPVVHGDPNAFNQWASSMQEGDTHTARLLMIEPIVKDTAESLLKEVVELMDKCGEHRRSEPLHDLANRARRLLEAK